MGLDLCKCVLTTVMALVCFLLLLIFVVACFVSRLVQEGSLVASECWRKPGLAAAAEDTSGGAASQLGLVGQSKSPQSKRSEIQKSTEQKN